MSAERKILYHHSVKRLKVKGVIKGYIFKLEAIPFKKVILQDLPAETLSAIFAHLPLSTITSDLPLVSKRIFDIVSTSMNWRVITCDEAIPLLDLDAICKAASSRCKSLKLPMNVLIQVEPDYRNKVLEMCLVQLKWPELQELIIACFHFDGDSMLDWLRLGLTKGNYPSLKKLILVPFDKLVHPWHVLSGYRLSFGS